MMENKKNLKRYAKWLRPALGIVGGMIAGYIYYRVVGCTTGACPITANPISSMLMMGLIGWLLSGLFEKECDKGCNM